MAEQTTSFTCREPKQSGEKEKNVGQMERMASSLLGGMLLAMGLKRLNSLTGLSVTAIGGGLLYRGVTGKCELYRALHVDTRAVEIEGVHIHTAVTINRRPEELYAYWRNLENLPSIMSHLKSVMMQGEKYSHWVAKGPAGMTAAWDAEIVSETENREILWRSREGSQITNAGSVRFVPAAGDRGTEVHVTLSYTPPAGAVGVTIAKMFGEEPHKQIEDDLLRFKQFMETGEIATTEGQPAGQSQKRRLKSIAISSAKSPEEPQLEPKREGNGHNRERSAAATSGSGTFYQEGEGL
jgi:uncharacterized membrane protein